MHFISFLWDLWRPQSHLLRLLVAHSDTRMTSPSGLFYLRFHSPSLSFVLKFKHFLCLLLLLLGPLLCPDDSLRPLWSSFSSSFYSFHSLIHFTCLLLLLLHPLLVPPSDNSYDNSFHPLFLLSSLSSSFFSFHSQTHAFHVSSPTPFTPTSRPSVFVWQAPSASLTFVFILFLFLSPQYSCISPASSASFTSSASSLFRYLDDSSFISHSPFASSSSFHSQVHVLLSPLHSYRHLRIFPQHILACQLLLSFRSLVFILLHFLPLLGSRISYVYASITPSSLLTADTCLPTPVLS